MIVLIFISGREKLQSQEVELICRTVPRIAKIKFNARPGAAQGASRRHPWLGKMGSLRGSLGASLRAPLFEIYFGDAVSRSLPNRALELMVPSSSSC